MAKENVCKCGGNFKAIGINLDHDYIVKRCETCGQIYYDFDGERSYYSTKNLKEDKNENN
jgi:hypothetical protein